MVDLLTAFVLFCLLVLVFYLYLVCAKPRKTQLGPPPPGSSDRVLIVTSHPDDECMFFAPTIMSLHRQGYQVYLLCLSRGAYYGKGNVREREIIQSCRILGISEGRCTVLDHGFVSFTEGMLETIRTTSSPRVPKYAMKNHLPDDPKKWWDEGLLGKFILQYISRTKPCMVVSFDDYGVSGHVNHCAVSIAIRELVQWGKVPHDIDVYELESVRVVRKYTFFLDLIASYVTAPVVMVASILDVIRAQVAMRAHWSQFVWFRVLYILTSRYMVVNTLWPVVLDPSFDLKHRKLLESRRDMEDNSST